jgi:hypothetical protein
MITNQNLQRGAATAPLSSERAHICEDGSSIVRIAHTANTDRVAAVVRRGTAISTRPKVPISDRDR